MPKLGMLIACGMHGPYYMTHVRQYREYREIVKLHIFNTLIVLWFVR